MSENKTKTYLALGDSYTIGTSIAYPDNFPNQLAARLKAEYTVDLELKFVAQNAWRTDDLMRAIKRTDLEDSYDLVSLLIGVNNQYQELPLADFEEDFRKLLDTAIGRANNEKNRVMVLSIPNYGYTPFGAEKKEKTTQELALFNASIESICKENDFDFFDVTTISLGAETREDYRANDRLHPSKEQYTDWVDSFWDAAIDKLNLK